MTFAAGAHAGMDGTFTILLYSEFEGKNHDEAEGKNLVFVSNAAGGLFLEKDEELERYAFVFDHLRASALAPDEAVSLIAGMAKEL